MCTFQLSNAFPREKTSQAFQLSFLSSCSLISGCTRCITSVGLLEIPRWRCCACFPTPLCLPPPWKISCSRLPGFSFPNFAVVLWYCQMSTEDLETIKPIFTSAQRKTLNLSLQQWKANALTHSSILLPFHLSFQPVCSVRENRGYHIPTDSGKQEAVRRHT